MDAPNTSSSSNEQIQRQRQWRRSQDNTLQLTREVTACVVRAEDEAGLHQSICRVIVERGGYRLAAIFEPRPAEQRFHILHAHGPAAPYLDGIEVRLDDSPSGRGPSPLAARSGRAVAINDALNDPRHAFWRERVQPYGIRSLISVPLKVRGEVRWLLAIYADKPDAFSPLEVDLLEQLADDVAYGMDMLHTRRERDQAMRLAQQATQRLTLATRGAGIGTWEYDLEADHPQWDEQTYRLFGHEPDAAPAPDAIVAAALGPEQHQQLRHRRNQCLREQQLFEMELHARLPNGTWRWLITRAQPTVLAGNALRLIGVIFDITDQVLARNALAERQVAEQASQAKTEFISHMSHELRTPLNAVLGFSALMRRQHGVSAEQIRYLDIIQRSGQHLLDLVNNVLSMSRIEAGRMPLEARAVDLDDLLGEVIDMMRGRAREKGLGLVLDAQTNHLRSIRTDAAKLRQILLNLLSNAIKFTPHGSVLLRQRHDARTQRLTIEVEDSGIGMRTEDVQRIFEPFVQIGPYSTEGGSGLGLTITRQFVALLGGTIAVHSTLGQGTVFRLELPATPASDAPRAAPREHARLDPVTQAPLSARLRRLSPDLRQALHSALISLDDERIQTCLWSVAQSDPALGLTLGEHASQLHYTPILLALEQPAQENPDA